MAKLDARNSGTFKIGGDIEIYRLGFGAIASPVKASGVHRKIERRRFEL